MNDITLEDLKLSHVAASTLARAVNAANRGGSADFMALASRLADAIARRSPGACVFSIDLPLVVQVQLPPLKRGKRKRDELTLKLAPSLNEYAGLQPWILKQTRAEIDRRIDAAKVNWPAWDCGSQRVVTMQPVRAGRKSKLIPKLSVSGGQRRVIEVVRYSSREVDELAVDVLGGKLILDRLIWAGVIAGDARKHIVRVPGWVRAKPDHGRLSVAVYEVRS